MEFFGRETELGLLEKERRLLGRGSRLAVIYGRRRVGKTRLMLESCKASGLPSFYFFLQREGTEEETAQSWMAAIRAKFGLSEDDGPSRMKPSSVIRYLMRLSKERPLTVMLDECQELDHIAPAFWSELQEIWDLEKDHSHLLLIMSGSIISAMRRIFGDMGEPLYGRTDLLLELRPFGPEEIRRIFIGARPNGAPEDLLLLWAVTGGVARYIEVLESYTDLSFEGIKEYIFSPAASFLQNDGRIVLANEFRAESGIYYRILKAIANGKTRWSEIAEIIPENISPYINRLAVAYRLINKNYPILSKPSARAVRYSIEDEYFRFWLKFFESLEMRSCIESGNWDWAKTLFASAYATYSGRSLENWFRAYWRKSGKWIETGGWWDRRGENELDLVAVNRIERKVEIAEIKRNRDKISQNLLEARSQVFLASHPDMKGFSLSLRALSLEDMLTLK